MSKGNLMPKNFIGSVTSWVCWKYHKLHSRAHGFKASSSGASEVIPHLCTLGVVGGPRRARRPLVPRRGRGLMGCGGL